MVQVNGGMWSGGGSGGRSCVVGLVLYEVLVVAGWSADRVVDGVMGGSCAGCLCQVVR